MSSMSERDELLVEIRSWLIGVANLMNPNMAQDLAQEGWIAAWKASERPRDNDDNLLAYMKQAARWRMTSCLDDASWLTATRRSPDSAQPALPVESVETLWHEPDPPTDLYEVEQAVAALPPRQQEYFRLRFWEGWTDGELRQRYGATGSTWARGKDKLVAKLGHLRPRLESTEPRKRTYTELQREVASERMRRYRARKKAEKFGAAPPPVEVRAEFPG